MTSSKHRIQHLVVICVVAINAIMMRHKGSSLLVSAFSSFPTATVHRLRWSKRLVSTGTRNAALFTPSATLPKRQQNLQRQQDRFFARFRWSDGIVRMSARAENTPDEGTDVNKEKATNKWNDNIGTGSQNSTNAASTAAASANSNPENSTFTESETKQINGQNGTSNDTLIGSNGTLQLNSDDALNVLSIDPRIVEIVVIENDNINNEPAVEDESFTDETTLSSPTTDILFRQLPFGKWAPTTG